MIDVLQLARKAADGRHAVSDGDAHSLRFDELARFADLVLEEAAKIALEEAVKAKEKYEHEQTWEQPYAGNRLLHLGWNTQDAIRAMKGQK